MPSLPLFRSYLFEYWKIFSPLLAFSLLCVWCLRNNTKVKCWKVVNSPTMKPDTARVVHVREPERKIYVGFFRVFFLYNALNVYCCTFLWCFSSRNDLTPVNIVPRWKEISQINECLRVKFPFCECIKLRDVACSQELRAGEGELDTITARRKTRRMSCLLRKLSSR